MNTTETTETTEYTLSPAELTALEELEKELREAEAALKAQSVGMLRLMAKQHGIVGKISFDGKKLSATKE